MSRVLRPHHGMCFQFYEGKGYSEEFTDHMGSVIRELEADPSQLIRLKVDTDIVCENCPNNEAGVCSTNDKVKRYDEEVLRAVGLADGDEISFAKFVELVKARIIDAGIRSDICGDCSWDYICREKGNRNGENMDRVQTLKDHYNLESHPEGGWFSEYYTSEGSHDGRAYSGSIYFLLDKDEISHFHRIDCEEIWFYHEGCGLKITSIIDGVVKEHFLGKEIENGQEMMVVISKGAAFASENLDKDGYTFVSCATSPKFSQDGFRLIEKANLERSAQMLQKKF